MRSRWTIRGILAATGPAGDPGLTRITRITVRTALHAVLAFTDPKALLFFTRCKAGKTAARQYAARLKNRVLERDDAVTPAVYPAQLAAVHVWGSQASANMSALESPTLIVYGNNDRMVSPANGPSWPAQCPMRPQKCSPIRDTGSSSKTTGHESFSAGNGPNRRQQTTTEGQAQQ